MPKSARDILRSSGLTLSPDVLALNPHLEPSQTYLAGPSKRAGRSRRSPEPSDPTALVLNGRRVRTLTEARAYAAIPRLWPGAIDIVYEAFSCNLGPTRYTWDYTFLDTWDGTTLAVEVKPERWDIHPSGRAALRSIKQASAFYGAHFVFVGMLLQKGGDWHVQVFRDGEVAEDGLRSV